MKIVHGSEIQGVGHGHLDDIRYDIAYGGVNDNGLLTMFGLAGLLPTSQDGSIERDQYLLGPEVAVGKIADWGIFGVWAKHLVSIADVSNTFEPIDYDTSETSLRLFFAYGLGNGWPEEGRDLSAILVGVVHVSEDEIELVRGGPPGEIPLAMSPDEEGRGERG